MVNKLSQLFLFFVLVSVQCLGQNSAIFPQGVASGDPLSDQVIIWTRLQTESLRPVSVSYEIALDSSFQQIISQGQKEARAENDYCIKVDVKELQAHTVYFYRFLFEGESSDIGRTKTLPKDGINDLKFAVVSCNHYEHGYFSAYRHLAVQPQLQAVIHLGDYIYEGEAKTWSKKLDLPDRKHLPAREAIDIESYRERYKQYRSDPDLQEAHRLHPFISIWDDHESANNSHTKGGDAHGPEDGNWEKRLRAAKKAYFEWMPIRDYPGQKIYRTIPLGDLADLILLDTRLEGRQEQIYNTQDERVYAADRTMLGTEQRNWLISELENSDAKWKVIANQVIFSPLFVGNLDQNIENQLMDIWDGYPAERLRITRFLRDRQIKDVVILTGDFHAGLAFEVPVDDWNFPVQAVPDYNAQTGKGAVAVEWVVPSISSYNFDEILRESGRIKPVGLSGLASRVLARRFQKESVKDKNDRSKRLTINPHLKYADLQRHGYMLISMTNDYIRSEYVLTRNPRKKKVKFKKRKAFRVLAGQSKLIRE